ncbi:MAG TPA: L-histidine N(alpha)-methyltransferase [Nitrosospira sp.]|nr:L-histidine N(alpha)-methyltransferase [Nitrosospira sp.]
MTAREQFIARRGAQSPVPVPAGSIAADVFEGLSRAPKMLPPKLFYDAEGSALFEQITKLPEYYPTRTEAAILAENADEICSRLDNDITVSELGAGTATKTRILLRSLLQHQRSIDYFPLDVSDAALQLAKHEIQRELSTVSVHPQLGDFEDLTFLSQHSPPRLVLYIGSSIGNLEYEEAVALLQDVACHLSRGDRLLLGVDLVKESEVLRAAYDDSAGVTAAFNKNLLVRINRELGGHFELDSFSHISVWNRALSRIEMHLESECRQTVKVDALNVELDFYQGERIHTENSYKYTIESLEELLGRAGFALEHTWTDSRGWFAVSLGMVI